MPEWTYALGLVFAAGLVLVSGWMLVRGLQRRELPTAIDGVWVEVAGATIAEDMVLEAAWRIPVIVSNRSRRPRPVLLLGQQALVRTERARYTAIVSTVDDWQDLNGGRLILNPGATALGDVWITLPAGETPRKLTLRQLQPSQRPIHARFPRVVPAETRSPA